MNREGDEIKTKKRESFRCGWREWRKVCSACAFDLCCAPFPDRVWLTEHLKPPASFSGRRGTAWRADRTFAERSARRAEL